MSAGILKIVLISLALTEPAANVEVQPGVDGQAPVITVRPSAEPEPVEPEPGDLSEVPGDEAPVGPAELEPAEAESEPEPGPEPEPPEPEPEPRRAPPIPPDAALERGVVGGYYDPVDLKQRDEPRDGEAWITTGAILLPLGLLQAITGGVQVIIAQPPRCMEVYSNATSGTCQGLTIFGAIGASTGGLMALTGVGLLSAGLIQRAKHRAWMHERGLALQPSWLPGGGGVRLQLRF